MLGNLHTLWGFLWRTASSAHTGPILFYHVHMFHTVSFRRNLDITSFCFSKSNWLFRFDQKSLCCLILLSELQEGRTPTGSWGDGTISECR